MARPGPRRVRAAAAPVACGGARTHVAEVPRRTAEVCARGGAALAAALSLLLAAGPAQAGAPSVLGGPADHGSSGAALPLAGTPLEPFPLPGTMYRGWGPPGWRLRTLAFGFADDYLGVPKGVLNDDNGFVARLRLWAELAGPDGARLELEASDQLITQRNGLNRVDQGKLQAAYSWSPRVDSRWRPTLEGRVGLQAIGDLGGSVLQNWAHHDLFVGRHLSGQGSAQLQYHYPRRTELLPTIGGLARVDRALLGPLSIGLGAWGEVGAGTAWFGELHPFAAARISGRWVELEVRESGSLYGTSVGALTMPGGYVTGKLEADLTARITLRTPPPLPLFLSIDADWNRGNSRQHVGEIMVGGSF